MYIVGVMAEKHFYLVNKPPLNKLPQGCHFSMLVPIGHKAPMHNIKVLGSLGEITHKNVGIRPKICNPIY